MAALASAESFSISVYSPGTEIHGANLDAAALGFYSGMSGPATYCPPEVGTYCPPVEGSLVTFGMGGMAVEVPGGQFIYVSPTGQVKYTQAHSNDMPPGSFFRGWFEKTVISECEPTIEVIDFLTNDGSNIGGLMLCPDISSFMTGTGASYQLYAKTPNFSLTNCVEAVGLVMHSNDASVGCWEYT
ncbi:uncharacterized protein BCR38DRAFT_411394 [Pseudomassariella vexata]|uniref:IgE-binding protein n=1 Tax=Pseudomassariella vexata TaxID=1141098 RepID=A0A1Y2DQG4_9PEZI|nr:uncharacterized protein BCR38DRAFT_411394 [Pseudomassariella vexata]ORY61528.1 hypothetical protein BCR38DRAFT_411394 [Pseudomassariella vexata]